MDRFIAVGDNKTVIALGDKGQYTLANYKERMRIIKPSHYGVDVYLNDLVNKIEEAKGISSQIDSTQIELSNDSVIRSIIQGISPAINIEQLNFNI